MPKTICSKCGGPREPESSSASWCRECARTYHRERYRSRMTAAGKTVVPRRQDAPNTAEGFEDRVLSEKALSLSRIKFAREIRQSSLSTAEQQMSGERCDVCNESVLTKENCNLVQRIWLEPHTLKPITPSSSQTSSSTTDQDLRAVHLIVGLACNECNKILEYVASHPTLPNVFAFYRQQVLAPLPVDAELPKSMQRPPSFNPDSFGPSSESTQPTTTSFEPIGPPQQKQSSTQYRFASEDPEYVMLPNWAEMSNEELVSMGPISYERRLQPANEQWYEDWTYHMQKRELLIDDELFDEERFIPYPHKS